MRLSGLAETDPVRGLSVFVVGYALVDLLPMLLPETPVLMGLRVGDLADVPLAFLLVALYMRLGLQADLWRSWGLRGLNALALVMMVQGHGIHLAANAIGGYSARGSGGAALAGEYAGAADGLVYFLDEHWGHIELHLALLIMAALFIARARPLQREDASPGSLPIERLGLAIATLAYGVLLAGDAVEGQTVPLIFPAAIVLSIWGFWPQLSVRSRPAGASPVSLYRRFFAASLAVTATSLVVYGLVMRGFPQPSTL